MGQSMGEAATEAATEAAWQPRIEIVSDRRRRHELAFRAMVVREAEIPGACVRDVARRHGICPSLIYRWRRVAGASCAGDRAVGLVPVRIADSVPLPGERAEREAASAHRSGMIEIELVGGVRVRVDEAVNAAALRRVLGVLRG
jgi:transposase